MNLLSIAKGLIIQETLFVSPKESYRLLQQNKALLIDTRHEEEFLYIQFNVENCRHFALDDILIKKDHCGKYCDFNPDFLALFEHNQIIILADSTGVKIKNIAGDLRTKGFSNFACLIGGIFEWERDLMPVRKDITQQLDGSCFCQLQKKIKYKIDLKS